MCQETFSLLGASLFTLPNSGPQTEFLCSPSLTNKLYSVLKDPSLQDFPGSGVHGFDLNFQSPGGTPTLIVLNKRSECLACFFQIQFFGGHRQDSAPAANGDEDKKGITVTGPRPFGILASIDENLCNPQRRDFVC
jgi:hypothetical protein